jgi:cysteine synthase A
LSVGERPEYAGKTIVTFAPSAAERYYTSDLFLDPSKPA